MQPTHNTTTTIRSKVSVQSVMDGLSKRLSFAEFPALTGVYEPALSRCKGGSHEGSAPHSGIRLDISSDSARQIIRRLAYLGDNKCGGVVMYDTGSRTGRIRADTDTSWTKSLSGGSHISRCRIYRDGLSYRVKFS